MSGYNPICQYQRHWLANVRDVSVILAMAFGCGVLTHIAFTSQERVLAALEVVGLAQIYTSKVDKIATKQEEQQDLLRAVLPKKLYDEFYKGRKK